MLERVDGEVFADVFADRQSESVVVALGDAVRCVLDVEHALGLARDLVLAALVVDGSGRLRRREPDGRAGGPASPASVLPFPSSS